MSMRRFAALLLAALLLIGSPAVLAVSPSDGETSADAAAVQPSETPDAREAEGPDVREAPPSEAPPSSQESSAEEEPPADPDLSPDKWYYSTVVQLLERGLDPACEDGLIHAADRLDRYGFIRILVQALDPELVRTDPELKRETVLTRAQELGLLTAEECTPEGLIAPFDRYAMAVILRKALEDVRGESYPLSICLHAFLKDVNNCARFRQDAVNVCYMAGILRGSGGLFNGWDAPMRAEAFTAVLRLIAPETRYRPAPFHAPQETVTRAEFVTMVNHALKAQTADNAQGVDPAEAHLALARSLGYLPQDDPDFTAQLAQEPVTRFQAARLLCSASQLLGETLQTSVPFRVYVSDLEPIPDEIQDAVVHCSLTGIIPCSGPNGSFAGADVLNYDQVCLYINFLCLPSWRTPGVTPDRFTKVIASFTTSYATCKPNSIHNSKLAAQAIGTRILQPGASLSFLSIVAPTTASKGYLPSTAIENGKIVQQYGGGVCQTSSTLYAAAVHANLRIVQRYNHSIRSTYIQTGIDASVYYPYADMVISNPYDRPIKIAAEVESGSLSFHVLGPEDLYVPTVAVDIVKTRELTYRLTRTADGVVNYSAMSYYKK